jgi:hypothetical protein
MAKNRVGRPAKIEEPAIEGNGARPKKMDMVRGALATLGPDAKPEKIHEHILTTYNEDLPKTIISNYKSNIKRKGGVLVRSSGKPGRKPASSGEIRIDDLEAVRSLVGRLGAAHVRRLVDVLS